MKRQQSRSRNLGAVLAMVFLVMLAIATAPAAAAVIAYEPFDYTAGQTLEGKSGGTDWGTGSWATRDKDWYHAAPTNPSTLTVVDSAGLSTGIPGVDVSGKAINEVHASAAVSEAWRPFDTTIADNSEVFMSVLFEVNSFNKWSTTSTRFALTDAFKNPQYEVYARQDGGGADWRVTVGYYQGGAVAVDVGTLNETFLLVGKWDTQDPFGTGGTGDLDLWVLDTDEVAALYTAGVTEANLNALVDASRRTSGTGALPTATTARPTKGADIRMYGGSGGAYEVHYDELRVGTTLGDAVALIPEPGTLGLVALGVAGLMVRRRRR